MKGWRNRGHDGADMLSVVVMSVPWTAGWATFGTATPTPGVRLHVHQRCNDFDVGLLRKLGQVLRDAIRLIRIGWTADRVVVCTTMADALAAAVLLRLRPSVQLAVWDFLLPKSIGVRRIARLALRRVDHWLVIRRGDASIFAQWLGASNCSFVPFPVPVLPSADTDPDVWKDQVPDAPFVYAAGSAHRDWHTLIEAARRSQVRTVISTNSRLDLTSEQAAYVTQVPLASPEHGRRLMRRAAAVCVPFAETDLPSGPLILLDAMSMGKPLVATDVNGSRDYVNQSRDRLLVPVRDHDALASALVWLTRTCGRDPQVQGIRTQSTSLPTAHETIQMLVANRRPG